MFPGNASVLETWYADTGVNFETVYFLLESSCQWEHKCRMGIIKDIEKGGGEIIRVEVSEFKGQNLLNIRTWYTHKESGEYKPTQKGIAIKPELFDQLKEAILQAESELKNLPE